MSKLLHWYALALMTIAQKHRQETVTIELWKGTKIERTFRHSQMVIAASAALATTAIALQGIQWTTFRLLTAESQTDYSCKIIYVSNLLQIDYVKAGSAIASSNTNSSINTSDKIKQRSRRRSAD
ncbi:hypothetical protein, partial [Phormidesmis sp. 146-33]